MTSEAKWKGSYERFLEDDLQKVIMERNAIAKCLSSLVHGPVSLEHVEQELERLCAGISLKDEPLIDRYQEVQSSEEIEEVKLELNEWFKVAQARLVLIKELEGKIESKVDSFD